jgi:AGCS family alanine or glycine:cation symporter
VVLLRPEGLDLHVRRGQDVQELIFKVIFCIFVVIGAAMSLGPVIDFSDAAIFAMALVNIIGLYFLMPVVKGEMDSYLSRLRSGEIRRYA